MQYTAWYDITISDTCRGVPESETGSRKRNSTKLFLKPDLYYEKPLRHAMRQALRQEKLLSHAVARAYRKS